jgi:NAD-dependent deacetylase
MVMGAWRRTGLRLGRYREVFFLTGAGVSVASGLPQYRVDGQTLTPALAETLDADSLPGSLPRLWSWASSLAAASDATTPNEAHLAISAVRQSLAAKGCSTTLATMNVDGLHQRAGDSDALELHGSVHRVRCTLCDSNGHRPLSSYGGAEVPSCSTCGAPLRPDVVLYHEQPDAYASWQTKRALRDADVILVVGSSARVSTVETVMRAARFSGARTIGINPNAEADAGFSEFHQGPAEELLPQLLTV